jgi:hypothetical protein
LARTFALPVSVPAQPKRPDFSGTWVQDTEASKALTEKKGQVWRVAGAGAGGARGAAPGEKTVIMQPITTITQSEAELVIERRFEDEVLSREVFKLDGSLSVNASRTQSSRTNTIWKGTALVTSGSRVIDLSSSNATDASGQPIAEINETFVTTRTLMPDGTIQVESRTTRNGTERIQYSVLVRTKAS